MNNNKPKALATTIACSLVVIATALDMNDAFAQSCTLDMVQPELNTIHSGLLDDPRAGRHYVISSLITNYCSTDQSFVSFFEVRNSEGVTERLDWQTGVVEASGATQIGFSWVPRTGGDYELRTFVISSLSNPQIISPIMVTNVTIRNTSNPIVIIPNDPDPSLQQVTFEPSFIKVVIGVNNTLRWINEDVSHRLAGDPANPPRFPKFFFIYPGFSFEHTFTEAGEFRYFDRDREWMHGTVWVIPHDAMNAHLDLEITGLKGSYSLNETIEFTVNTSGFETGCGTFGMVTERIDDEEKESSQQSPDRSPIMFLDCGSVATPYKEINYRFPFPEADPPYSMSIDQAGTYRITVWLESAFTSTHYSAAKEFVVMAQ